jgi:excisionase family DNA binding protein
MDEEHWLTVQEIANLLKVHPQSIRRWLKQGELRGVLISDRSGYRVRRADLDAFLERRGLAPLPKQEAQPEGEG